MAWCVKVRLVSQGDTAHLYRGSTQQTRRDDRLAYICVCAEHLTPAAAAVEHTRRGFMLYVWAVHRRPYSSKVGRRLQQ